MLEKNSHVVLTDDDLKQYYAGVVSERIKQTWGIESIEELGELVKQSHVCNKSNQG